MSKNSNLKAQQSGICFIFAATFVVQDRKRVPPFLRACCILLRTRREGRRLLHFACTGLSWGFLYIFWAYWMTRKHCHTTFKPSPQNATLLCTHGEIYPVTTMCFWKTELNSSPCACGKTSPCPTSASLVAHKVAASHIQLSSSNIETSFSSFKLQSRDHRITICRSGLGQASALT